MSTDFIVYEAKAFYNAYIGLEQLNREVEDKMLLWIPMLVNGAFSIEITLKAILFKRGIEYGKEHNLLILFEMLPKSIQDEIWSHLAEKAPEYADPKRRTDELILISNAFVDYRYVFEGKVVPAFDMRFLSAFANAAICTMFSLSKTISLQRQIFQVICTSPRPTRILSISASTTVSLSSMSILSQSFIYPLMVSMFRFPYISADI